MATLASKVALAILIARHNKFNISSEAIGCDRSDLAIEKTDAQMRVGELSRDPSQSIYAYNS